MPDGTIVALTSSFKVSWVEELIALRSQFVGFFKPLVNDEQAGNHHRGCQEIGKLWNRAGNYRTIAVNPPMLHKPTKNSQPYTFTPANSKLKRHQKTKSTINPGGIQPLVPSQSICPSTSSVAWGGSLTFRMGRSLWHFTKQILSAEDAEFEDIRPSMAALFVPSNNPLLLLFRTEAPQQGFVIKIHRSRKRQNGSPERDLFWKKLVFFGAKVLGQKLWG